MAAGATLFALMNFFARLASSSAAGASWATVGAVRALVGAAVALVVARTRGAPLRPTRLRPVLWRSLFGTIAMMGTFYSLSSRTLPLGDTATLLNLTPVFLAVLAPIVLRERTTRLVSIAIALSLLGVVLILRPAAIFGAHGHVAAATAAGTAAIGPSLHATAATAVLASFSSSLAMMMLRRIGDTESPEAIAFHFSLFAAVVLGVVSLAIDPRVPSSADVGLMIAAGVCAGFAQLAMTRAYALESAARVGGLGYLSVVVSTILGALVLHEPLSVVATLGMGLVIAGGLASAFGRDGLPSARGSLPP
jgi:drug/metabolite transporter (DMT)-like permease